MPGWHLPRLQRLYGCSYIWCANTRVIIKEANVADSNIPIQETSSAAAADSRRTRWQEAGRDLRCGNFQLFFSGQLISLIGTWMQTVAQSWLVYRLTGSGFELGAVGFASQIPVFLFAPIGGIVADRTNRKHVVIATQVASMLLAFALAALTLTHTIDHRVWMIYVLAALLGVVNAFDIPGRQSFLVDMVGKEDLMNAIALNSSMFNGARVIGPAVAGILVARIGEGWCFFANAVSYIAVIIGLLMMRVHSPSRAIWISVVLLLPVGYFMMLQMSSSNTLIQVMVPDALRGRVMAVYSMMFMGMAPIGALFGGAMAEHFGAPMTVAIGGVASLAG